MKDVADVFGNLSGKLFKPEIQGNRKVPVDSSDIDFAIVRFGKQTAGPCRSEEHTSELQSPC